MDNPYPCKPHTPKYTPMGIADNRGVKTGILYNPLSLANVLSEGN